MNRLSTRGANCPGRHARFASASASACAAVCESLESRRLLSLTVPVLNSRPGAFQTLYLDFDGSTPFNWDNGTAYVVRGPNSSPLSPSNVPAFSTDGDFNNYSASELDTINHIWQWVSEKYSPFTINVTTVNPNIVQDGRNMTCLVGGSSNDWLGATAGGDSDINGFEDGGENTCFAFSANAVNNGLAGSRLEQYLGETIAHEAGHEVALVHQRTSNNGGSEYYPGDITRAPIMGGSSNNTTGARGIWWDTNNWAGQNSPDQEQDDLAALTFDAPFRLQYRSDTDGANLSFNTAGKLNTVTGLINNTSDVDAFPFDATGTHATFTVKNWQYGGMLAPTVRIRISGTQTYVSGTTVTANTNAAIDTSNLTPGGHYVLEVGSQGQYGDIGQYTIDGSQTVFAAYDSASRTISVGGFAGNNNIHMSVSAGVLTIQDSVNGGATASQNFTASAVDSISINLGAGDDVVNWDGLFKGTDNPITVYTSLGGGFDTLKLGNSGSFENITVDQYVIDGAFGGHHASIWNFDAEKLELDGSVQDDTFNINSQNSYSTIWVYGGSGNDTLYESPQVVGSSDPPVIFHGEQGTDGAIVDGSTLAAVQSFVFYNNTLQRFIPGNPFANETQFDTTVENITVRGGAADDSFQILSEVAGQRISAQGYGGADTFILGKSNQPHPFELPFTANIFGTVNVLGSTGDDLLQIDDAAYTGIANGFTVTSTSLTNPTTGANVTFDSGLDRLEFYGANNGSRFVTLKGLSADTAMNFFGGTGSGDTLIVEDQAVATAPFRADFTPDAYIEYFGTAQDFTTRTLPLNSGWENFRFTAGATTNTINVYGTGASPVGQNLQINASNNADTITLFPHDASGNLTIAGGLTVFGSSGTDTLIIDDTASAFPINYQFTNTFAGLIDRIDGMGAGTLSPSGVENIQILAGDAADTFALSSFKLSNSVSIAGGEGNDLLNIGGNNMAANFSNNFALTYDGQGGSDSLSFDNLSEANQWSYTNSASGLHVDRLTGGAYGAALNNSNVELVAINGGTGTNVLAANAVAPGLTLQFNGNSGADAINLPSDMSAIEGAISFNGGGGTNNINTLSNSGTTPTVAHLTQNSFGALPGDNYFGAGGGLFFDSLTSMTFTFGSGADIVYAQPNATATVSLRGGSPASGPSDVINLALAGAPGYAISGTAATGNVTSDLATLSWSGFEDGPNVDDAAPAVADSAFDWAGSTPSIGFQFSEDVSGSLDASFFAVTNLASGETIPASDIALSFDATTNLATLTFPNYAGGALPDGNYRVALAPGVRDVFGNVSDASASLDFFVMAGDFNHDRKVDIVDLGTLAANWQQPDRPFALGDANYDGVVNIVDLGILASKWQQVLDPPADVLASIPPSKRPKISKPTPFAKAVESVGLTQAWQRYHAGGAIA